MEDKKETGMNKLFESEVLKEYVERYSNGRLDLNDRKVKKFFKEMGELIVFLVPEANSFLVKNGLEELDETIYIAMGAIGATLKDAGERRLNKLREREDESNNNLKLVSSANKLWQ